MLRRSKVWQLRKINRKTDKDYEMIIIRLVCIFVNFPKKNLTSAFFTLFDQSLLWSFSPNSIFIFFD